MKNKKLFVALILTSSCMSNEKEFKDGRIYKRESFEEWDERTKDSEIRRQLDSSGVDSKELKRKNLESPLKVKRPIRMGVKTAIK